jgi:hypothetical protein
VGQSSDLIVISSGAFCWANASSATENMNTAAMAKHETIFPFFIPGYPPFVFALPTSFRPEKIFQALHLAGNCLCPFRMNAS